MAHVNFLEVRIRLLLHVRGKSLAARRRRGARVEIPRTALPSRRECSPAEQPRRRGCCVHALELRRRLGRQRRGVMSELAQERGDDVPAERDAPTGACISIRGEPLRQELHARGKEGAPSPTTHDCVCEPLLQVEVLAARGERREVEDERIASFLEHVHEPLHLLARVERTRDGVRRLGVQSFHASHQHLPIDVPDAAQHSGGCRVCLSQIGGDERSVQQLPRDGHRPRRWWRRG
mmetsp:Transcript_13539/g.33888  ORF Transcript_13539/g.33888 Transcript_13539/m.33888 type:complete len:235 (-) Transcript_13539:298-1002(-)